MSLVRFLSADDAVSCFVLNCTGICVYDSCTPPPLIPTNGSDPDPTPTRIQLRHPNRLLFYFLIAAASLLALSFLLLLLSYFLLRLRRQRRRLRLLHPQNHNHNHNPPPFQDPDLVDDLGENDGGTHHIWYIRTVGLDEHVIKSIAAKIYKSGEGLIDDGGDCAVCLGEFVDGEAIKILPKCSHAFHLPCIDTWLRSHVNCPLCRAAVVVGPAELDGAAVEIVDTPITNGEEAAVEEEEEEEEVCVVVMDLEAGSSSSSNSRREESELQPIRRSVSMDSSSSGLLMLRAGLEDEEKKLEEEKRQVELREEVVCKNGGRGIESLGKLGAEMKRSLSSRSGRMFFTRYGRPRGRSSSVLPL